MSSYYNEINLHAAQWLRNLIAAGHIAPGVVDTRSIEDVQPDDLRGFTQCHFFAGIGVWSHALRAAGWPDDRPVWTGSCPCQPFSAAGKGAGFDDERHLWPAFHHLIAERRPAVVLGEQVASKDVDPWIDLVHADMEALGYAFGSVPFPSAGVGAPHIRDRNYWCGTLASAERQQRSGQQRQQSEDGGAVRLGYADGKSAGRNARGARSAQAQIDGAHARDADGPRDAGDDVLWLADSDSVACGQGRAVYGGRDSGGDARPRPGSGGDGMPDAERPGPINGFWRAADWLGCTDGKWRPVEPGTFPLAYGAASRVGRLRAYGNAVNAEAARVWIDAVMECQP